MHLNLSLFHCIILYTPRITFTLNSLALVYILFSWRQNNNLSAMSAKREKQKRLGKWNQSHMFTESVGLMSALSRDIGELVNVKKIRFWAD